MEPFSWSLYSHYLHLARASGYRSSTFDAIRQGLDDSGRHLLLRHDIDYDPRCARKMSQLEVAAGLRSTYFFQVHSPFYRIESPECSDVVRELVQNGHWLGLHFDATQVVGDDAAVVAAVREAAESLEDRFNTPITAVSFHMPSHRPIRHLILDDGRINTYAPIFFEQIAYVSDSNQHWRGKDLARILLLDAPRWLQVLTHPIWWRETFVPFLSILEERAEELGIDVYADILTPEQWDLLPPRRQAG